VGLVLSLLTDEAWLTMPPSPLEYQGRLAIAGFMRQVAIWHRGSHAAAW
jgi:hypothetical protein